MEGGLRKDIFQSKERRGHEHGLNEDGHSREDIIVALTAGTRLPPRKEMDLV